jgi:predicted transcriptional regulator
MERILLSIKPKYVEKILAGEKIYELRRVIPNENIDIIFIYSSNPIKKIVGYASIDCILELPLDEL